MNDTRARTPSRLLTALIAAALFLALIPGPLLAQSSNPDAESQVHRLNGRYFAKMGADLGRVVVSPLHWKGQDLAALGVTAGVVAIAFSLDETTKDRADNHTGAGFDNFSLFVTHFGEGPFLIGFSAALYAGGEAFKNDGLRKTGLMSLESFAVSGVVVTALKLVAGRHRPLAAHGAWDFNFFSTLNHEHSFPSGHSASAFAVASTIAGTTDSFWLGAVSYGLASIVAVSRVANSEHWLSDIIVGSALGYFIGKKVLDLNRASAAGAPSLGFGLAPGGFSLSLRF